MTHFPWLTAVIFLPLLGAVLCLAASRRPLLCRWTALVATFADLGLSVSLFFHPGAPSRWFLSEDAPWIRSVGVRYSLAVDGVSLLLVLLTSFLLVLCVLVSWRAVESRVGPYHFFLLFTETGILGVFLARDLFLFYLFWEVQILPMFFLIGVWGHEDRVRATIKFILYTIAGSLLMLVALIALYLIHGGQTGSYTFGLGQLLATRLDPGTELWLAAAFLLAFAIKVPAVPLHNWLPDAHTQAPTAGSVILAGLLLKTGTYALFRIGFPLFPGAVHALLPLLLSVGLAGLFYAGWIAFAQRDVKRLVAYSSVAHMGLVIIGLAVWNALTLNGALLQMLNHGLSTSALFILVGMIDERLGSRALEDMGGLWRQAPALCAFFLFFALSALGLPGLNNFVGEVLILIGTFREFPAVAVLGFSGLVITLLYVLRMVQRTVFGPARPGREVRDLGPREALVLGVLAAAVLFAGLRPQPILDLFRSPVQASLQPRVQTAMAERAPLPLWAGAGK